MKRFILLTVFVFSACSDTRLVNVLPDSCVAFNELCNGIDDDCDGKIDELEDLAIKPCYSGEQKQLLYGICRFGVEKCVDAGIVCFGEVKPDQEVCNDIDDNCNGLSDEIKGPGADIIFAIDYSCSMAERILIINKIITNWSEVYADAGTNNIRAGLIGIPSDKTFEDENVKVMLPLSDINTFVAEINQHTYDTGGSSEPSLDAIYFIADRTNPLGLNWTPNYARAILMFTDEPQQSYTTPRINEADALNMAISNNVTVFVFTNDFSWRSWKIYPLFTTAEVLSKNIQEAIDKGMCQ